MTDAELIKGTLACACLGLQGFNLIILFLTCIFKKKVFKHDTTFEFAMLCSLLFNLFLMLSFKFLSITPWGILDFICLTSNCILICLFTLDVATSDIIMLEDN